MGDRLPGVRQVDFGDLRRLTPLDPYFGYGRGTPIDRYYIERFLRGHAPDIRGSVLEVKDAGYTHRFGGEAVTRSEVMDIDGGNPAATLIADLTRPERLPEGAYDCVICTQTLHFVFEVAAAVQGVERMLRPGGVALLTVPAISRSDRVQRERSGEYWRFTAMSLRRILEAAFPPAQTEVTAYGNVFSAISFLHGLALEDVETSELDVADPEFEVLVAARCVKRAPG